MEIKFRGKTFDNIWVYGYYQEVEAEGNITDNPDLLGL